MSTAAILAGGQARRFGGRRKALLPLGDQRIIDRLLGMLRSIVDEVVIVANDRQHYDALGVPVRADVLTDAGPLGGVHAALAASSAAQTLVVAGDMPFLSAPFLEQVLRSGQFVDIALPRTADGYQPLCASYRASCAAIIERRINARALKVAGLLEETRVHVLGPDEIAPFDPNGMLLFNINTPADYARALTIAAYRRESS